MDCDIIFKIELLKSVGYKEECSGYNHIKHYTKNNTTFVISNNTNRISVYKNNITHDQWVNTETFFKMLKNEI